MIGIPFNSANCLEGLGNFPAEELRPGGGAPTMRVPNPAAGMMTTTFMRARVYRGLDANFKSVPSTAHRVNRSRRFRSKKMRVPETLHSQLGTHNSVLVYSIGRSNMTVCVFDAGGR